MSLAKPVCALKIPFATLTITLAEPGKLPPKFIFEIVGLLDSTECMFVASLHDLNAQEIGQGQHTYVRRCQ